MTISLFNTHQKLVAEYGRQDAECFARVLKFVVLTIRTRLAQVPSDMETLDLAEAGEASPDIDSILYGSKRGAVMDINANKDALFSQAESIVYHAESEREAAESLVDLFSGIYGLGLAKAGFCAQLLYGLSGCLDSHNLERLGISPNLVKSSTFKNAKTLATRRKWLARYQDIVESQGGTSALWDSWCEYVAARPDETGVRMNGNKPLYESAFHVSALHCLSLGIEVSTTPS